MTDFQQANRCFVERNYEKAIRLCLRHAANVPNEAGKAYVGIAECCLRSNVINDPVSVAPGIMLVSQGDLRGAEYYFRLALQADPENARALSGLSELLPDSCDERLELLERSVRVLPTTLNLVALGDYYRSQLRDFEHAHSLYKQAQEHAPRDQMAYSRLSNLCRRMGRPEEAKEWTQRWQEAYTRKRRVDGKQ